jgi:phage terminase Nu1 subunit (DNA packaging protein)
MTEADGIPQVRGQRVNQATMAKILGRSAVELGRMTNRGCPVLERTGVKGKEVWYDSAAVIDWCIKDAAGAAMAIDGAFAQLDGPAERARLWHEQANGQEMKNAQLRRELAHWNHVRDFVQAAFANARQQALAIPTKAAPDLIGQDDVSIIKDRLTEVVHDVLAELAAAKLPEWLALSVAEEADREGDARDAGGEVEGVPRGVDAAAEADGEPVGGRVSAPVQRRQRRARPVAN